MLDLSLAVHFWRLWLVDNAYKKQQYKNILNVFTLFWSLNMNPSNFNVQRSNDWTDSFGPKLNLNLDQIVFFSLISFSLFIGATIWKST